MNVVDSLVVTLGLDPSDFTKGQKEAATSMLKLKNESVKSGKDIEGSLKKAGESVDSLVRKVIALYAVFTAGKSLKQFVSDMTASDAATGRAAKSMDLSARTLSTFQNMAEAAGGSAEGITSTMEGLTGQFQSMALTGQSSVIPYFRALGVDIAGAGGKMRPMNDLMRDLNRHLSAMDPARAAAFGKGLGIDPGTMALLQMAPEAYDRLQAEMQRFAASREDIDAAQERQRSWRDLMLVSQSFGRSILTDLTPAILSVTDGVRKWAVENRAWLTTAIHDKVEQLSKWLATIDWKKVSADVQAFAAAALAVAEALARWVTSLDWDAFAKGVKGAWTEFDNLSKKLTGQDGLTTAMEAFGAILASSVLMRLARVVALITRIAALPVPAWFLAAMGVSAAAQWQGAKDTAKTLGSDDPTKNDVVVDPESGMATKVEPGEGNQGTGPNTGFNGKTGFVPWIKNLLGFGGGGADDMGDRRVKDAILSTAENTKKLADGGVGGDGGGSGGGEGGVLGAVGQTMRNTRAALGGHFTAASGGGTTRTNGLFKANQNEAYAAALKEGLSPTAARALVANMSGEGLAVPHDNHWDGKHYSQGIVQWDPTRAGRIAAQFGKQPKDMSVAEQTRAAIWEMKTRPEYAASWNALQGDNAAEMIGTLVDNYERPKQRALPKAQRMGYYRGFNPGETSPAPVAAASPAPAPAPTAPAAPIGDQAALDAQSRIAAGQQRTGDAALIAEHRRQQNAPAIAPVAPAPPAAPAPTPAPKTHSGRVTDLQRGKPLPAWMSPGADGPIMTVDRRDPRFAPKPGDKPVKVEMTPGTVGHLAGQIGNEMLKHRVHGAQNAREASRNRDLNERIIRELRSKGTDTLGAAEQAHRSRIAMNDNRRSSTSHSETHIGTIQVATAATDARGIAADLEPHLRRGGQASQANYGLI